MIEIVKVVKYINQVREENPHLSGKQCMPLIMAEIKECEPVSDYELESIGEAVWERVKRLRPLNENN